jgi:magnesium-dependent phosphatase 1
LVEKHLRIHAPIDYEVMVFFDDEMRNITEVSRLGVTSVFVESGMSMELFQTGLSRYATSCDASRS